VSSAGGRMFVSCPGCNVSAPFAFGAEAADADGAEPDPSEPVAAEPRRAVAEPDGHDLDVMGHS